MFFQLHLLLKILAPSGCAYNELEQRHEPTTTSSGPCCSSGLVTIATPSHHSFKITRGERTIISFALYRAEQTFDLHINSNSFTLFILLVLELKENSSPLISFLRSHLNIDLEISGRGLLCPPSYKNCLPVIQVMDY